MDVAGKICKDNLWNYVKTHTHTQRKKRVALFRFPPAKLFSFLVSLLCSLCQSGESFPPPHPPKSLNPTGGGRALAHSFGKGGWEGLCALLCNPSALSSVFFSCLLFSFIEKETRASGRQTDGQTAASRQYELDGRVR